MKIIIDLYPLIDIIDANVYTSDNNIKMIFEHDLCWTWFHFLLKSTS